MALIANLAVALTAQTGQFSSKMRGATKSVRGFASSVAGYATGTTAKLTGLIAALTGVGSVAALGHFTKRAMEGIDVTAKLADRLNVTTEGLTGLGHAAALAGSSTEELGSSLDRLQKNLGQGGTEIDAALRLIGQSRESLIGKGAVEQFKLISDGVNRLATSESRAAVITALFGKTGQNLTATLALGSKGLNEAAEEARKLGIAFSRVDAYKVEAANDAISKMQSVLKGAFMQLGIAVAPVIQAIADKVVDLTTKGGGLGKIVIGAIEGIASATGDLITFLEDATNSFRRFGAVALRTLAAFRWGDAKQLLLGEAMSIETNIGQSQARQTIGQGWGDKFDAMIKNINDSAQKNALDAQTKAAAKAALEKQVLDAYQAYAPLLAKTFRMGGAIFAAAFNGAGRTAKIDSAYQRAFQAELASAFDPRAGLFSESFFKAASSPIEQAASAGTRGTFAADTASRSVGSFTIQQKQLDALEEGNDKLDDLIEAVQGGIALP